MFSMFHFYRLLAQRLLGSLKTYFLHPNYEESEKDFKKASPTATSSSKFLRITRVRNLFHYSAEVYPAVIHKCAPS